MESRVSRDAGANAAERGRGVVADVSVGKDAAANCRQQRRENLRAMRRVRRAAETLRLLRGIAASASLSVQQRGGVEKFARFENCARTFDSLQPTLRIGEPAESHLAAGAQPFARLADLRERRFERVAVRAGFKSIDRAATRRRRSSGAAAVRAACRIRGRLVPCATSFYFSFSARYCATSCGDVAE